MSINKAASDAKSFRKQFAAFWRVAEALEEMGDLEAQRNDMAIHLQTLKDEAGSYEKQAAKAIAKRVEAEAAEAEAEARANALEAERAGIIAEAREAAEAEAKAIIAKAEEEAKHLRSAIQADKKEHDEWKRNAEAERAAIERERLQLRNALNEMRERFK